MTEKPEVVTSKGTALGVCRPVLEIIVWRILLKLQGDVRAIPAPTIHALVAYRTQDPVLHDSFKVVIKGVARHPMLSGPVRFVLYTLMVEQPELRIFAVFLGSGSYEYDGRKQGFSVESSLRDHLQVRPHRQAGDPGPVRFNRYGRMKVRRSDYD